MQHIQKGIIGTHIPASLGKFASNAPTILSNHTESHIGNGPWVTCAKIILPTWCANCSPHAQRKGTNNGDCKIVNPAEEEEEEMNDGECNLTNGAVSSICGWLSHANCIPAENTKGRRSKSGWVVDLPEARMAVRTFA